MRTNGKKKARLNPRRRKALKSRRQREQRQNFFPDVPTDIWFHIINFAAAQARNDDIWDARVGNGIQALNRVCVRSRQILEMYRRVLEGQTKPVPYKGKWNLDKSQNMEREAVQTYNRSIEWRVYVTSPMPGFSSYFAGRQKRDKRRSHRQERAQRMLPHLPKYIDYFRLCFQDKAEKIRSSIGYTKITKTLKKPRAVLGSQRITGWGIRRRRRGPVPKSIPICLRLFGLRPTYEQKQLHQGKPKKEIALTMSANVKAPFPLVVIMRRHGDKVIRGLKKELRKTYPTINVRFVIMPHPTEQSSMAIILISH